MSGFDKSFVYISSICSVQNFSVIKEENFFIFLRLTQQLEDLGKDFHNVDCGKLKIGDILVAKANSRLNGTFFRSKVTNFNPFARNATVVQIDTGKMEIVPFSSLLQLPDEFTLEVTPPLAITNCKLDCFAPSERSRDVFLAVTTTKRLLMQVIKSYEDGSLEVDLLIHEDEDTDQTVSVSVRDILVIINFALMLAVKLFLLGIHR